MKPGDFTHNRFNGEIAVFQRAWSHHRVSPLRARAGQESNNDENRNGIANTHVAGHEVSFKRLAGYAAPRLVKTIGEKTTDNCWFSYKPSS
jgi:hypothetical protein